MTQAVTTAQLDERQLADIRGALAGIAERAEQYEQARDYDSINLWESEEDSRAGRLLRQAGVEYDPNYCSVVINAIGDGMVIDGVSAVRDPEAKDPDYDDLPAEDEEATQVVNAIWEAQKMGQFYPSWQRKGLRDGDAYVMLWAVSGTDIETVAGQLISDLTPDQLNITYMDPMSSRLFYDSENPRIKSHFAWVNIVPADPESGDDKRVVWRLNLMYSDRIERYVTAPRSASSKEPRAEDFMPYVPDPDDDGPVDGDGYLQEDLNGWQIPNPFGTVSVFHLRTDVQYGMPVHINAYGPQDAIGETIERMMTTMAFQSWPQTYALQEAENMAQQNIREDPLADDYDDGLDDFGDDTDRDTARDRADMSNETGTDLEATPGGMLVLKGFKAVSQLQTADPSVFLEPWREFAKTVADTTGTPPWTFRAIGGEIPSGVALDIAREPQTSRRQRCAHLFGAELTDLLELAAAACGYELTATVQWAPFQVVDETERWTLVKLRTDAGVPLEHALIMAGIPARQARQWAEEKELKAQEEFERQQALKAPPEPVYE
jgi:hypothetical protein